MSEIVENVTQNCHFMICFVREEQSTKIIYEYDAEEIIYI
jgi:hypothetical protein